SLDGFGHPSTQVVTEREIRQSPARRSSAPISVPVIPECGYERNPEESRMLPAVLVAAAAALPHIPFEKYQLPNGLTVLLSEDHRAPVVGVDLWYHVGAVNERAGRSGFAHLFEHLMFQGSKHLNGDERTVFAMLERNGATNLNGTTEWDRTNYFETMP